MKRKKKGKEEVSATGYDASQDVSYYGAGYNQYGYYPADAYNNAYYGGQYVEPLDASGLVHNAANDDPNIIVIVPGRDGVPYNISPKGIENLTRIERLRRNGVISDTNYEIMRQKIIGMFLQN